MKTDMPADSRGPTMISQPLSSSSLPLIVATPPGITAFRWLTCPPTSDSASALAIVSALNLSAAQAVMTDCPSVSTTRIQAGAWAASVSASTVK